MKELIAYTENGKWGYRDKETNEILIPAIYDEIDPSFDDLSFVNQLWLLHDYVQVKLNDKWGVRTVTDEEILPLIYDEIKRYDDDSFLIKINDKRGIVSNTGETLTPIIYHEMKPANCTIHVRQGEKWGAIDKNGNVILAEVFDEIDERISTPCMVVTLSGKKGIMSYEGRIIVYPDCEDVRSFYFYNTFGVKKEGKWQIVDRKNRPKNAQFYDDIREISGSGMFAVLKDGKWRFIYANGQDASSVEVDEFSCPNYDLLIRINEKWGALNWKMEEMISVEYDSIEVEKIGLKKYKTIDGEGVVDRDGHVVIPPVYDDVCFVCKYAYKIICKKEGVKDDVFIPAQCLDVSKNDKHGVIDIFGNGIIPIIYDKMLYMLRLGDEDIVPACKDGKWGYISNENQIIIPFIYDDAYKFKENTAIIKLDGKSGLIDKTGRIILPPQYELIDNKLDDIIRVWENGKIFEMKIDSSGKIIEYYDDSPFFNTEYLKNDSLGIKEMNMHIDFLQQLCNTHSTSAQEEEVFCLMKQCFEMNNWSVDCNKHYLIANKDFSKDLPTILFVAHADSPGWKIRNYLKYKHL